jgi:hypothetical protein
MRIKGQAAIEFLMTYGWAIFVIIIVLGALAFYLTQFVSTTTFCATDPGFACNNIIVSVPRTGGQVNVSFRLSNNGDQAVNLINVTCERNDYSNAQEESINSHIQPPITPSGTPVLNPGQTVTLVNIPCYEQGTKSQRLSMGPNQNVQGVVIIKYNYTSDFVPSRVLKVSFRARTTETG